MDVAMRVLVCGVVAGLLAGCGGGAAGPTGPVEVAEVVERVDYYYACGNEVLELADGRAFYPLERQDQVDPDDYLGAPVAEHPDLVLAAGLVLAVAEPGPGDDVGTLTIYDDGMAHYVSDSGIEAWLDTEVREYGWEC